MDSDFCAHCTYFEEDEEGGNTLPDCRGNYMGCCELFFNGAYETDPACEEFKRKDKREVQNG